MTVMIDINRGSRPELRLDLNAIAANSREFTARCRTLMAVVKADGFGHGAVAVARTAVANGANWLGVTSADEAHELRDAGLRTRMLSWLNPVQTEWTELIRRDVELAVPSLDHLAAVRAAAVRLDRPARIHLQADVGLARDGAAPSEWTELCLRAERAEQAGSVQVVGLMGHLATADDGPDQLGRRRFERFLATAAAGRPAGPDYDTSPPRPRPCTTRIVAMTSAGSAPACTASAVVTSGGR